MKSFLKLAAAAACLAFPAQALALDEVPCDSLNLTWAGLPPIPGEETCLYKKPDDQAAYKIEVRSIEGNGIYYGGLARKVSGSRWTLHGLKVEEFIEQWFGKDDVTDIGKIIRGDSDRGTVRYLTFKLRGDVDCGAGSAKRSGNHGGYKWEFFTFSCSGATEVYGDQGEAALLLIDQMEPNL